MKTREVTVDCELASEKLTESLESRKIVQRLTEEAAGCPRGEDLTGAIMMLFRAAAMVVVKGRSM